MASDKDTAEAIALWLWAVVSVFLFCATVSCCALVEIASNIREGGNG